MNYKDYPNNLPFTVEYTSTPNCQLNCQNNLNVLPNGPLLPSRPLFPSSLPPSLSQYPSNMQTNFINVRREACICNLRTSSFTVDSGLEDSTIIYLRNLPELDNICSKKNYYNLVINDDGQLFKKIYSLNKSDVILKNINGIDNIKNLDVFTDPLDNM